MTPRRRVSRRRFLSLLAGSAAVFASPALAASAAKPAARKRAPKPAPAPPADPVARYFDESLASTRASVAVLRKHPLPPGSPLAIVFRPLPLNRKGK